MKALYSLILASGTKEALFAALWFAAATLSAVVAWGAAAF